MSNHQRSTRLFISYDFETCSCLSFEEVQAQTGIPQSDLVNVLTSLSVIKQCKVLLKESQTKAAAKPGDKFSFNREFVSKAIKLSNAILGFSEGSSL